VNITVRIRLLSFLFLFIAMIAVLPRPALAHPADRLLQQIQVSLYGDRIESSYSITGGLLATGALAEKIDQNGDGAFSADEAQIWLQDFLAQLSVTRDGAPVAIEPSMVSLAVPPMNEFSLGLTPLVVNLTIPTGLTQKGEQKYDFTNAYRLDLSDFKLNVAASTSAVLASPAYPGKIVKLLVDADPTIASEPVAAGSDTSQWGGSGVISHARDLLERPKTPLFVLVMLLIFASMGALHALQPGHGKTLVAAYIVATGGTPRDAMTLAGIVTATHTLSVYLLGGATLLASQWFLPARVIPALTVFSGLLVAGMGLQMLWRSTRRWRPGAAATVEHHQHDEITDEEHAHFHAMGHEHHHDHAALSDEEHARLHATELDSVFVERNGKRRVSPKQLLVLGISGGIAPCPDALAILLLAIGIGQAAFGMVAIMAFSVGLALVLIAFGMGVALLRPAWNRITAERETGVGWTSWASAALNRAAIISPVISAVIVLALGVVMLARASIV
jgi:nickel/cobalt transporter (NicO) family protein